MTQKGEAQTVLTWIDLETTGLDPDQGRILEFAAVFTDLQLNQLAEVQGLVAQPVAEALPLMNDYVRKMHTENGLLDALANGPQMAYCHGLELAETKLLLHRDMVRDRLVDPEVEVDMPVNFIIAGNTIGFDKAFIKAQMPSLFKELHYRQLDVSSYKVGFPEIFGSATSEAHRAMDDIRASIAQHSKMREIVEDAWKYEQLAR